jgi:hypothetical protein
MLKEPDVNLFELSYNPILLCRVKLLKKKKLSKSGELENPKITGIRLR